jgi:hypothetical protein
MEVKMDAKKAVNTEEKSSKLTYEQLEALAHQLSEQSKQLAIKLQQANMLNTFKRVDYLFKVIENSDKFNSDFVIKSSEEIEQFLTIPEEDSEDSEETKE